MGAVFDRQPGGALALAREGGHSTARVVHAGGAATGAEVERALVDATRSTAAAVLEEWFALDLLVEGGRCRGVRALERRRSGRRGPGHPHRAGHRRCRSAVRRHHQPGRGHRRRPGHGPAGRGAGGRRGVHAVPSRPRSTIRPCPDPCCPRPCAATGPCCATPGVSVSSTSWRRVTWSAGPWPSACASRGWRACGSTPPAWPPSTPGSRPSPPRCGPSGSTRRATGCPSPRPPTTCPVGCSPTCQGRPPSPACGPPARWPAPGCTGPTGWPPTRCSRGWCSGPAWPRPSRPEATARARPGPWAPCSAVAAAPAGPAAGPQPATPVGRWRPGSGRPPRGRTWPRPGTDLQRAMIEGPVWCAAPSRWPRPAAPCGAIAAAGRPRHPRGPGPRRAGQPGHRGHQRAVVGHGAQRDPGRPCPERLSPRAPTGGAGASSTPPTGPPSSTCHRRPVPTTVHRPTGIALPLTGASEPAATGDGDPPSTLPARRWSRRWPGPSPRTSCRWATSPPPWSRPRPQPRWPSSAGLTGWWPAGPAPSRRSPRSTRGLIVTWRLEDGAEVAPGDVVAEVSGSLRSILTAERTALNFLGHLSGVASLDPPVRGGRAGRQSRRPGCSTPGRPPRACGPWRRPRCGPAGATTTGAACPRPCWSRTTTWPACPSARRWPGPSSSWPGRMVEVECDRAEQVDEAVAAGATVVMLDNMDPEQVAAAWPRCGRPGRERW